MVKRHSIMIIFFVLIAVYTFRCVDTNTIASDEHIINLIQSTSNENLKYWVESEKEKINDYDSDNFDTFISYINHVGNLHAEFREFLKLHPCQQQDEECITKYADHLYRSDSILIEHYIALLDANYEAYAIDSSMIKEIGKNIPQKAMVYRQFLKGLKAKPNSKKQKQTDLLHLEAMYNSRLNDYKELVISVTGGTRLHHPTILPMAELDQSRRAMSDSVSVNLFVVDVIDPQITDIFVVGKDTIGSSLSRFTSYSFSPGSDGIDSIEIKWERVNRLTGQVFRRSNVQALYIK